MPADRIGKALSCGSCKAGLRVVAPGFRVGPDDPTGLLVIRAGPHGAGEQIFLAGDVPIQVGKLPGSDIRLQGRLVSRSHCRLSRGATGWQLEDQGSTNGVYVNGVRVGTAGLRHGDRVRIGEFQLGFLHPSEAAATAVPVAEEDVEETTPARPAAPAAKKPAQLKATPPPPKIKPTPPQTKPPPPKPKPPIPKPAPAEEPIYGVAEEIADDEWTALASGGEKVARAADLDPGGEATAIARSGTFHPHVDAEAAVAAGRALAAEAHRRGARSFWADVGWSFLFFTDPSNLISFFVFWVVLVVGPMIPFAGILVSFWYAAFRFAVVEESAAGEDALPSVRVGDFFEDLLYPALRWTGSWILVLVPAFAYLVVGIAQNWVSPGEAADALSGGVVGMLSAATGAMAPLVVLVYAGMFLWPMVILCLALGGFTSLHRVDLILRTVAATLPGYLVTVALVFGTSLLGQAISGLAGGRLGSAAKPTLASLLGTALLVNVLVTGISLYTEIVAMRAIGLYYHHFKAKFAWDWG